MRGNPAKRHSHLFYNLASYPMLFFVPKVTLVLVLSFSLAGCGVFQILDSEDAEADATPSAKKLYEKAQQYMKSGNYSKSIELYRDLAKRYPFGDYTAQTQLDIAYAYYKSDKAGEAIKAIDNFIKTNPTIPSVDYAYYLKGLVYFTRDIGLAQRFLPTDSSQRNIANAQLAHASFAKLIHHFPTSRYAKDASQRMLYINNNLAMHEIHIARFYMRRHAYIAAVNRASFCLQTYPQTPAIPHALKILQDAYSKQGLETLAADVARVYQLNFQGPPPTPNRTLFSQFWGFIGFD